MVSLARLETTRSSFVDCPRADFSRHSHVIVSVTWEDVCVASEIAEIYRGSVVIFLFLFLFFFSHWLRAIQNRKISRLGDTSMFIDTKIRVRIGISR